MRASPTIARTAAVAALALTLRLAWARFNGVDLPIGPDSAMWVLVGLDRLGGSTPPLPPLYPALISLAFALGLPGAAVARWLSLLAGAAVAPLVTGWLDRRGADPTISVGIGVFLAFMPDLVFEAVQTQPDSLTQLWLVGVAAVGLSHLRAPSARTACGVVALAAVGVLLRETGLPVLGLSVAMLAVVPGPGPFARILWPLTAVVAAHIAPVFLGLWPALPLTAAPWAAKASVPQNELVRVLGEGFVPSYSAHVTDTWYLGEPNIHLGIRSHYDTLVGLAPAQRLRVILWLHGTRAMELSRELYALLVGCGLVVLAGARREKRPFDALFILALLAPVLITVVVWTQRRHVVAYVPAALLCAGLALPAAPRRELRALILAALFVALCAQAREVDAARRWTQTKVAEARPMVEFGRDIREKADGRTVLAGITGSGVTQAPGVLPATAGLLATSDVPDEALRWSAVWVLLDNEPQPEGWTVLTRRGRFLAYVWGAELPGELRRCKAGVVRRLAPVIEPKAAFRTVVEPGTGCGEIP